MKGETLRATVERYNSFVDAGKDADFGKPTPKYKIQTPPFYAAWATPNVHDTRSGLRINAKCQVMDMNGQVIPGLYCGWRVCGRLQSTWLGQMYDSGLHRRNKRRRRDNRRISLSGRYQLAKPDGAGIQVLCPIHFSIAAARIESHCR